MNFLKIFSVSIFILIGTSACMTKSEAIKMQGNQAIIIVGIKGEFDDESTKDIVCDFGFKDKSGDIMRFRRDQENGYFWVRSEAGKSELAAIGCISNRVFYNKIRRKEFKDINFNTEPGTFNYLGDFDFKWLPESFKVGDLLTGGGGGLTADDGKLIIKYNDNIEGVKSYLKKEYPKEYESFKFKKVDIHDSNYFIK